MNRLMESLPAYYWGIKEFQELTDAQSNQLDLIDGAMEQVENDQFIMTSSESAILQREKMFKILADPSIETLDFRKNRIINRQTAKVPFTVRYLKWILERLVGADNYEVKVDVLNFYCEFLFQIENKALPREIDDTLERIMPLNLNYRVVQKIQVSLYLPCAMLSGEEITVYPWRQTTLETKGHINLGTFTQAFETATVYPQ